MAASGLVEKNARMQHFQSKSKDLYKYLIILSKRPMAYLKVVQFEQGTEERNRVTSSHGCLIKHLIDPLALLHRDCGDEERETRREKEKERDIWIPSALHRKCSEKRTRERDGDITKSVKKWEKRCTISTPHIRVVCGREERASCGVTLPARTRVHTCRERVSAHARAILTSNSNATKRGIVRPAEDLPGEHKERGRESFSATTSPASPSSEPADNRHLKTCCYRALRVAQH